MHWLTRSTAGHREARHELDAWLAALADALRERQPDAIVLQYSVFAASRRGIPVDLRAIRSTLARAHVPVIVIGHELAFPFGREGLRGLVWAVSQRVALRGLVRSSSALIVTTDDRARWLSTRRWLPARPVRLAPVYSNLPPPRERSHTAGHDGALVGLFGYSYPPDSVRMTLKALALLRASRPAARLVLLGAPGSQSEIGREWLALARELGVSDAIEFSGTLPGRELSDALASCDVLIFIDRPGPTSRKGSLAGALASGRPVIATDGPSTWQELVRAGALRIAPRSGSGRADEIRALLENAREREALGERGRTFHDRRMAVSTTADAVLELYELVRAPLREANERGPEPVLTNP
jgi:glycosyltransferase involved in cell wall biosynthesis